MSSRTERPSANEHTPWDELTTARQRVVLTVAHVHGPTTFNRPDLREDVEESESIGTVIDDKDRVLTSLKYTTLLNELVDDGYLVKEFQGGTNPIILDVEYQKERDTRNTAPFRDTSALHTIVDQIRDREGITRELLNEVGNPNDFNEVREKVNHVVGWRVLRTYSDPSEYRITKGTFGLVKDKIGNWANGDN